MSFDGVVDLGDVAERQRVMDTVNKELADKAAAGQAEAFDKAMQRAFKGIVSRPERHKRMRRAVT